VGLSKGGINGKVQYSEALIDESGVDEVLVIPRSLSQTVDIAATFHARTSDDRWVCRKAASTEKSSIISAGPQLRAWKVAALDHRSALFVDDRTRKH
jgi:hypothetical protein